MTAEKRAPEKRVTVEDLRKQAMQVRDMAEEDVRTLANEDAVRKIAVVVIVFAVAVSVAFYFGTRRCKA